MEKGTKRLIAAALGAATGTDDTFVPIEMTYRNYKACAAPKRLLVVPGAGHCQSYLLEQKRYEEELLRFWQKFDEVDADS